MNLYIFGNGFDLMHNIPSGYNDFTNFLKTYHLDNYKEIGDLFYPNKPEWLWENFEDHLGHPQIINSVKKHLQSWETTNSVELYNLFDEYDSQMKNIFSSWVLSMIEKINDIKPQIDLSKTDYYITFNYTSTLESVYDIPRSHILYIHGKVNDDTNPENLIIGHGVQEKIISDKFEDRKPKIRTIANKKLKNNVEYEMVAEIISDEFCRFIQSIQKPVKDRINEKTVITFMENLRPENNDITNIYVLGHSLSEVDIPYFKMISDTIPYAQWHINIHSDDDNKRIAVLSKFNKKMGLDAVQWTI